MERLCYEEQVMIKLYNFSSTEELKEKLKKGLEYIEDEDMRNVVINLIPKIDRFTVEELRNIDNIYE